MCHDPTDPDQKRGYVEGPVAKNRWFNRFSIDEGNEAPCAMPCHKLYHKDDEKTELKAGESDYPNPIDWTSGGLRGDGWGRFTPGCIDTGMGIVSYGGYADTNKPEVELLADNAPGLGGFGMFSPGSRLNRCSNNPASVSNPFYKANASVIMHGSRAETGQRTVHLHGSRAEQMLLAWFPGREETTCMVVPALGA